MFIYIEACQDVSHRCTQSRSLIKTLFIVLRRSKIRQEFVSYSALLMIYIWYRACNLLTHKHQNALSKIFFNYIFRTFFLFNLICLRGKYVHFVLKRQTFSQNHTELQNHSNLFVTRKIKTQYYSIDIFISVPFRVFLNIKALVI